MFQEINKRLADLKMKQRRKTNGEKRMDALKQELKQKKRERDQWETQLQQEQKDVDRLTGVSLGALFYSLLGKRDDKILQEEAELLQAKLKYDEAADTVIELESEQSKPNQFLNEIRFVEDDIEALIEEKTKLIHQLNPSLSAELQRLTDREAELRADVKELQEAVSAGRKVVSALSHAEDRLSSAQDWGTFDLLGGGMISTAMKHSRIDEARSSIHAAQNSLRRFQAELEDVQRDVIIEIDIGSILTFADYFFDGLISDWMVQSRIKNSLDQVFQKRTELQRIVTDLESETHKAEVKLQTLQRQYESLIKNA